MKCDAVHKIPANASIPVYIHPMAKTGITAALMSPTPILNYARNDITKSAIMGHTKSANNLLV